MVGLLGSGFEKSSGPKLLVPAALGNHLIDIMGGIRPAITTLWRGKNVAQRFVGVVEIAILQVRHGFVPQRLLLPRGALQFRTMRLLAELPAEIGDETVQRAMQFGRLVQLLFRALVVMPIGGFVRKIDQMALLISDGNKRRRGYGDGSASRKCLDVGSWGGWRGWRSQIDVLRRIRMNGQG